MRHSLALLALTWASCTTEPSTFERRRYACVGDDDCLAGYLCVEGLCTTFTTTGGGAGTTDDGGADDGGESDGGAGDAGAGDGGAGGGASGPCAGPEVCGDLLDDNCNGILDDGCECDAGRPCYPNAAGDFFPDGLASATLRYHWDGGAGCSPGLQECAGGRLSQTCTAPHVPQQEYCDGRDNDCDGVIDLGCGCQNGRPCYNGSPFTNGVGACHAGVWNCALPLDQRCANEDVGSVEACDGLDNDCNGAVDDEPQASLCGPGVCSGFTKVCQGGAELACDPSPFPGYVVADFCGDALDNNCDGVVDDGCACIPDAGQGCFNGPATACPLDGGACVGLCQRGAQRCLGLPDGGAAWSGCAGQTLPRVEDCADGVDDDCDGFTDCADPNCAARACGAFGRVCFAAQCQCVHDGGVTASELCANGIDDDCDGLTDCAQGSCAQKACGTNGKTCLGDTCTCVPADGGVSEHTETRCADGVDNDCDGLKDCGDSDCAGVACGGERTCQKSLCTCLGPDGGTPQVSESLCFDGVDNDCDGLADWAEPSCLHRACSPTVAAAVWCSAAADGCKDLSTDPGHCGLCGVQCHAGEACTPAGTASGVCGCSADDDCPLGQNCFDSVGKCDCNDKDSLCGGGSNNCRAVSGPDYCTY